MRPAQKTIRPLSPWNYIMNSDIAYEPGVVSASTRNQDLRLWVKRAWIWMLFLSLPFARDLGGANFALLFVVSAALILTERRFARIPYSMYFLSAIGLLYVALSYGAFLNRAWTAYFETSAIPQQAAFLAILPASFYIFREYLSARLGTRHGRMMVAREFISLYVLGRMLGLIVGTRTGDVELLNLLAIPALSNSAMLLVVSATLLVTCTGNTGKFLVAFAFCLVSAFSDFSQNYVLAVFFVAAALLPSRAFGGLLISIAICIVVYLWMLMDPAIAYSIDYNSGIRLLFFLDALDGFVSSGFIGVGFGTESIRNYYSFFGQFADPYSENTNFIQLAAHNSFATVAFRMGIVGFLALIWLMYSALLQCRSPNWKVEEARKCITLFAAFLVILLNPALESPFYYYGVGLCFAAIWASPRNSRDMKPPNHARPLRP